MFKKTLVAVAALGAFAGSAMAADLTVYGLVDYGFAYQHVDMNMDGVDAQDSFKMNFRHELRLPRRLQGR